VRFSGSLVNTAGPVARRERKAGSREKEDGCSRCRPVQGEAGEAGSILAMRLQTILLHPSVHTIVAIYCTILSPWSVVMQGA
jgi:hypothetical protein